MFPSLPEHKSSLTPLTHFNQTYSPLPLLETDGRVAVKTRKKGKYAFHILLARANTVTLIMEVGRKGLGDEELPCSYLSIQFIDEISQEENKEKAVLLPFP